MEQWRDIPRYEGVYAASSKGRIKRVTSERILASVSDSKGYRLTHLCKDGRRWLTQTHRLVAMSFLQPNLDGLTVNHLNGIKHDNRLVNLEVVSHKANIHHAIDNGLRREYSGAGNPNAKLTAKEVSAIRNLIKAGKVAHYIAKQFNVSITCIDKIREGRTWTRPLKS